jgi:hypothetical protein
MDLQAQNRRGKGSVNRPIRLSPTQARQGITPHVTRHVLVWGSGQEKLGRGQERCSSAFAKWRKR